MLITPALLFVLMGPSKPPDDACIPLLETSYWSWVGTESATLPISDDIAHCLAVAYVEAMRLHDISIWAFEIEERCSLATAKGPSVPMFDFTRGADDRGCQYEAWAFWGQRESPSNGQNADQHAPESEFVLNEGGAFFTDGYKRTAFAKSARSGVVGQDDPHTIRLPVLCLDRVLGRWVSRRQVERLGDLMLKPGSDLSMISIDAQTRVARVRATFNTGSYFAEVVVDIDPSRGYAPVRTAVFDAHILRMLEQVVILDERVVDGVWLPTRAAMQTYFGVETAPDDARSLAFSERLSSLGIDRQSMNPEDAGVRREIRSAVRDAFGDAGFPVRPISDPHVWEVLSVLSINRAINASRIMPADFSSFRFSSEFDQLNLDGQFVAPPESSAP